jgi:hypothetical protein
VIWFACRGKNSTMPDSAELPAYQAMLLGLKDAAGAEDDRRRTDKDDD